ncbi:prepilin-type N-terminal cleavage/methylation domain-containing protein [Uliginosibacterium sp. H3]|uniref:Prepilin-type N-terminal cleavage/methylation domain-containing protein n=1 Tax=Uliginosibacterium silvisoli TaxID=3114758 RepID=A0ABU6K5W2_9RHOO|nr:prepilin-type N-terminal cleavage/methylation domain-containing protein [Uliginosibacterium sp. H3]
MPSEIGNIFALAGGIIVAKSAAQTTFIESRFNNMRTQQSGFTLVEIAIVLVIIGLLLGGVLKGQELINSAKAKAVIADFRNTATMVAAYQDRFRALPGDDKAATTHVGAATANGDGDGLIESPWNSVTPAEESALAWQHLRLANLVPGALGAPAAGAWEPTGAESGRIGIQSTRPTGFAAGRFFVCEGNVSGRIAQQVDTTIDDGTANGGSVRAYANSVAIDNLSGVAAIAAYVETDLYIVCSSF